MYLPSFLLASLTRQHNKIYKLISFLSAESRTLYFSINVSTIGQCPLIQAFKEIILFCRVFFGILSVLCFSISSCETVLQNRESVLSSFIFSLISDRLFNSWLKPMSNDKVFSVMNDWLIDNIIFYAISTIFRPTHGGKEWKKLPSVE